MQCEEINQKVLVKEGRLKRYWDRIKQYRQNRTLKKTKIILPPSRWGNVRRQTQQLDDKKTKQFWSKLWKRKEHKRKAKYISNIRKELEGPEEAPMVRINLNSLRTTLKKVSNWKMLGYDGIHGYWFRNFTFLHDRLTIKMNRCLKETYISKWITKGKTTLIWKKTQKNRPPQQLQTHNTISYIFTKPSGSDTRPNSSISTNSI